MSESSWPETILVPTDFSPVAERALGFASDFARHIGSARLILANAFALPLE